ncbi:MAG: hypothetical protein ACHQQR_06780, partial [Gemmatimonadales bacterium]
TVMEVLSAHLESPPPSLREVRTEIPAPIEALVHRMMAKQPADRFPSLREVERAFRALVPDEGGTTQIIASYSQVQRATGSAVLSVPKVPGLVSNSLTAAQSAETVRTQPGATPSAVAAPSSRSRALLAAAAGVALLVFGAIVWQRMHAGPATATISAPAAQPRQLAPAPAIQSASPSSTAQAVAEKDKPRSSAVAQPPVATATTTPVPSPAVVVPPPQNATPRVDSSPSRPIPGAPAAPAPPAASDAASPGASASIADARKIGRDFATMLNQRRYRELAQVPAVGGDAALRAELIRLVQNATDFAAGFDRVASAPESTKDGFMTDFVLDLEWQGGRRLMVVQAFATMQGGSWHLAAFGVEAPR